MINEIWYMIEIADKEAVDGFDKITTQVSGDVRL